MMQLGMVQVADPGSDGQKEHSGYKHQNNCYHGSYPLSQQIRSVFPYLNCILMRRSGPLKYLIRVQRYPLPQLKIMG